MVDFPFAGQMTSRVLVLENTTTKSPGGELLEALNEIGTRSARRADRTGNEVENASLQGVAFTTFTLRYEEAIAVKASQLVIRDFDGDWQVVAPMAVVGGRRRYMDLKCRKRGEH